MKKNVIIFLRSFYGVSSISEVRYSGKSRTFYYNFITMQNGKAVTIAVATPYTEMARAIELAEAAQVRRKQALSKIFPLG